MSPWLWHPGSSGTEADRPKIPGTGGLAGFVSFNISAFATIAFAELPADALILVLSSLVVIAGAGLTGALDDLIALRQRFKAAIPLALFVEDTTIWLPFFGGVDFGLLYAIILVPAGVACASNRGNMLEGSNGLGMGSGNITGLALGVIVLLRGDTAALAFLSLLLGAMAGFWVFNAYPAKVFPGDGMILMVGPTVGTRRHRRQSRVLERHPVHSPDRRIHHQRQKPLPDHQAGRQTAP